MRGLAALAVAAGHLRSTYFSESTPAPDSDRMVRFFFWMTGLQGLAVKVFFVLSGFWAGGAVVSVIRKGGWSWGRYLVQRLSRLYTVLIPALLLTLLLDDWGKHFGDPRFYRGAKLGWDCFLGNLLFLQQFIPPVYGSNNPLWSLSCEFWYYLLFPALLLVFRKETAAWKKASAVLGVAAAIGFLPGKFTGGGFIWLAGAAAWVIPAHGRWGRIAVSPFFFAGSALLFTAGLSFAGPMAARGVWGSAATDILLAAGCAGMLPWLMAADWKGGWYSWFATRLSDVSYSLYLVHFPLLGFLIFGFGRREPLTPAWGLMPKFAALFAALLLFSWVFWYFFERRTAEVRRWFGRWWIQ